MAYQKHNYQSGSVLYASQLNEMDDQIAENEAQHAQLAAHGQTFEAQESSRWGAMDSFLTEMKTLIPQLAYTVQNHNGGSAMTAINTLQALLSASGTTYTVTKNLSHCTINNSASSVTGGAAYSATITPSSGYTLGAVTVTMGWINITSTAYNSATGAITIASVTGDISITATATENQQQEATSYTVTKSLSHCALNNNAASVTAHGTYTATVTAENGYTLSEVVVVMGGANITSTVYNSTTGAISIASVTGNVTISATAIQNSVTTYTITKNLTRCTASNSVSLIQANGAYSVTITANGGYTMSAVSVTMGGTSITGTAYNSATGTISIGSVTGNVVITATATAAQGEVSYSSQALYSNYTATGSRFSTGDIAINFANGDYVEALIDTTTCTADAENILAIGKNGTDYIGSYNTAVAFLFYKRAQSGVDKILLRVKDVESNVSVDKWIVPNNLANVLIKVDKNGVYIDGTLVSGITAAQMANLLSLGTYMIGARASALTTATYDHITVYRVQEQALTYTVTNSLANCTTSNNTSNATSGGTYSATLAADTGYTLGTVLVVMGGANITSTAYNSSTGAISIAEVTGDISITADAVEGTYTADALYTNYTATGTAFGTGNQTIDFSNGDYVEALVDITACTNASELVLAIGKGSAASNIAATQGVKITKNTVDGVDKLLVSARNTVSVDGTPTVVSITGTAVTPNNPACVLIKMDKTSVYIDGERAVTSGNPLQGENYTMAAIVGSPYWVGGGGSSLPTTAVYDHITIFKKNAE